jgi:peptide/nickel transport system ATP-binding protein/oligopeptide transport system ATP-binding protein
MIFQEPMTSLNPVFTIGDQIGEAIMLHQKPITKKESREKTIEMLKLVGIPIPEQRVDEYPHQLSGGMRQRIMIAMALSCNPSLLIADEPTTALDVTIQAQILELLSGLQEKLKMGVILITHNLGVVAETADNIAVMYAGKIIEYSDVRTIFANAQHPYTKGLLGSVPKLNAKAEGKAERLTTIDGVVPAATDFPSYCRFSPRCKYKFDKCEQDEPPLFEIDKNHKVACFLMQK